MGRSAICSTCIANWRGKLDILFPTNIIHTMPASLRSLESEALHLAPEERLQLAHALLASVEPGASAASEVAWHTEITRRIAEFDAGRITPIPGQVVFDALDRRLAR